MVGSSQVTVESRGTLFVSFIFFMHRRVMCFQLYFCIESDNITVFCTNTGDGLDTSLYISFLCCAHLYIIIVIIRVILIVIFTVLEFFHVYANKSIDLLDSYFPMCHLFDSARFSKDPIADGPPSNKLPNRFGQPK